MPVKRSRVGSSSSLLATPFTTAASASVSQVKVMRSQPPSEPPRQKVLTFASPVSVGVSDQTKIGGFLERCHYCKKLIAENSEIFMYSTLCAFCSAQCRDFQIALDQSAEKQPKNAKENSVLEKVFYN